MVINLGYAHPRGRRKYFTEYIKLKKKKKKEKEKNFAINMNNRGQILG
jgi:hypothetical protein